MLSGLIPDCDNIKSHSLQTEEIIFWIKYVRLNIRQINERNGISILRVASNIPPLWMYYCIQIPRIFSYFFFIYCAMQEIWFQTLDWSSQKVGQLLTDPHYKWTNGNIRSVVVKRWDTALGILFAKLSLHSIIQMDGWITNI